MFFLFNNSNSATSRSAFNDVGDAARCRIVGMDHRGAAIRPLGEARAVVQPAVVVAHMPSPDQQQLIRRRGFELGARAHDGHSRHRTLSQRRPARQGR